MEKNFLLTTKMEKKIHNGLYFLFITIQVEFLFF